MIVESYDDVIVLSGALHSNQWETLHTAISLQLKRHPEGVILDCSGLTDVNARGGDTFRSVMEFLEHHDARVIVASVPDPIMEILRTIPDVRSQLPISATVEAARTSLQPTVAATISKRKAPVEAKVQLLVVVIGAPCDQYVLQTAVELASGMSGIVHVMHPLIVPRELPLQSPLADQESRGREALRRADVALAENRVHHDIWMERGRDTASALASALQETPAITHVVVGLPPDADAAVKLAKSVLNKVCTAVLFVRGPQN